MLKQYLYINVLNTDILVIHVLLCLRVSLTVSNQEEESKLTPMLASISEEDFQYYILCWIVTGLSLKGNSAEDVTLLITKPTL